MRGAREPHLWLLLCFIHFMSLILDCSVTMAWIFGDETTDAVTRVFESVSHGGAWVPGIWRLEVANVLEMAARRRRRDTRFRDATLADLTLLPIQVDLETDSQAWNATLRLAERHVLTLYDAAYLELALRRSFALATLDRDLRRAASAEKVRLMGE